MTTRVIRALADGASPKSKMLASATKRLPRRSRSPDWTIFIATLPSSREPETAAENLNRLPNFFVLMKARAELGNRYILDNEPNGSVFCGISNVAGYHWFAEGMGERKRSEERRVGKEC